MDRLSWDNDNQSLDLIDQIETFHRRFGFYPESVHADKISRTRTNRAYCKQHGIRMSGPPLGRRPQNISAAEKKQTAADEAIRNTVEGTFGQGKRRFGLGRVMAKLADTSAAQISLSFLVMNLELALRRFFFSIELAWGTTCSVCSKRPWTTPIKPPHEFTVRGRNIHPDRTRYSPATTSPTGR